MFFVRKKPTIESACYDVNASCCLAGSRPQNLPWKHEKDERCQQLITKLKRVIWNAVKKQGYRHFYCGMAVGIDTIAAKLIIRLRSACPELGITFNAAIPCQKQDKFWTFRQKWVYRRLCSKADTLTFVSQKYSNDCYKKRNMFMVDNSSLIIAVTNGLAGGTMQTVNYAKRKSKAVLVLDP